MPAKKSTTKSKNKKPVPKMKAAPKPKARAAKPVPFEKPQAKVHPFANFMRMQTVYQSNAGHAQKFSSYEVYRKKAV